MRRFLRDLRDSIRAIAVVWRTYRRESAWNGDDPWWKMPRNKDGWTCFHCGASFTNRGAAAVHFGERPSMKVGCRIDIEEYRNLRDAHHDLVLEITALRAQYSLIADEDLFWWPYD